MISFNTTGGGGSPWPKLAMAGIVFILVVYFIGRSYGKTVPPSPIPVPQDDPNVKPGSGTPKFDPKPLTDRLYQDIKGWSNPFDRDMDAWNNLASLSDTNFVIVLNDWDARYYNKWTQTLYQAYMGEKFNPLTSKNLLSSLSQKFERLEKGRKA